MPDAGFAAHGPARPCWRARLTIDSPCQPMHEAVRCRGARTGRAPGSVGLAAIDGFDAAGKINLDAHVLEYTVCGVAEK